MPASHLLHGLPRKLTVVGQHTLCDLQLQPLRRHAVFPQHILDPLCQILPQELLHGQVDGHGLQLRDRAAAQKPTHPLQHDPAQGVDQAVFLGHWNKLRRRDGLPLFVGQPDQSLRRIEAAGVPVIDRLIPHLESAVPDSRLHGLDQILPAAVPLGRLAVEPHQFAPVLLAQTDTVLQIADDLLRRAVLSVIGQLRRAEWDGHTVLPQGPLPAHAGQDPLQPLLPLLFIGAGYQKQKLHAVVPEDPASGRQLSQSARDLEEERVATAVAIHLIHPGELLQCHQDDLIILPASHPEGQLLHEAPPVVDTGKRIPLDAAALEADENDQIRQGAGGPVQQLLGISHLIEHQQHYDRRHRPHDTNHGTAHALAVAEVTDQYQPDLQHRCQEARRIQRTAAVITRLVKIEDHSAVQIPKNQPCIDDQHQPQSEPGPLETALVIDEFQQPLEDIICNGGGHQHTDQEIGAVQCHIYFYRDPANVFNGMNRGNIQQNRGHGQQQTAPEQAPAGRMDLLAVIEKQHDDHNQDQRKIFRKQRPSGHTVSPRAFEVLPLVYITFFEYANRICLLL